MHSCMPGPVDDVADVFLAFLWSDGKKITETPCLLFFDICPEFVLCLCYAHVVFELLYSCCVYVVFCSCCVYALFMCSYIHVVFVLCANCF